ncbi:hypothetical protein L1O03_09200 [Corynebacterium uropygiale]|uniref:Uncharacterized protein n=1 Tax=Corynebacterium uropygiale TaxID=1775911 RepID=A0A9X1QSF6_9CORY|nr:hypothetical protein [Corynebacterium uropygiale]MCF4007345.1 hypothetical protein [Corynebacterium uropygiale]
MALVLLYLYVVALPHLASWGVKIVLAVVIVALVWLVMRALGKRLHQNPSASARSTGMIVIVMLFPVVQVIADLPGVFAVLGAALIVVVALPLAVRRLYPPIPAPSLDRPESTEPADLVAAALRALGATSRDEAVEQSRVEALTGLDAPALHEAVAAPGPLRERRREEALRAEKRQERMLWIDLDDVSRG